MIWVWSLCPCLDRILYLDSLKINQLNRPRAVEEVAGGKGLNLLRAHRALGGEGRAFLPLGGWAGEAIRALASQEGLPLAPFSGPPNRLCHILVHGKKATEVYEPCPPLRAYWRPAPPEDGLGVLSGSLPPDLSPEEVLEALRPFAVDSASAFAKALELRVGLIKPNREELARLQPGPPLEAARRLFRRYGVRILASLGRKGAFLVGPEGTFWASLPPKEGNPVGSGDALLGGFLAVWVQGGDSERALRYGVAAGWSNVGRGGGRILREEVEEVQWQVRVERL